MDRAGHEPGAETIAETMTALAVWCDRCGGRLANGAHRACAEARALEPPRFCPTCRRRMKVQVLPAGWRASCTAHGTHSAPDPVR